MIKHLKLFVKRVKSRLKRYIYILNCRIINININSLYYSSIEVLIDFINSVITLHVFYKQLHFSLQPQVTYGHMNFQSESCVAVAYSIHFQPHVT